MTPQFNDPNFPYELYPHVSKSGIWEELRIKEAQNCFSNRPALFLDRDGVIVKEVNYLQDPKDVELIEGAAEVIALANKKGIPVIMVTNQAGIAYGYFGWAEFKAVQDRVHEELNKLDAKIDAVYACPFHQKGETFWGGHPDHEARKPNPGMLNRAAEIFKMDLTGSWIVGDRASDLEAGRKAGISGGLHVFTGHGSRDGELELSQDLKTENYQVQSAGSIQEALNLTLFQ